MPLCRPVADADAGGGGGGPARAVQPVLPVPVPVCGREREPRCGGPLWWAATSLRDVSRLSTHRSQACGLRHINVLIPHHREKNYICLETYQNKPRMLHGFSDSLIQNKSLLFRPANPVKRYGMRYNVGQWMHFARADMSDRQLIHVVVSSPRLNRSISSKQRCACPSSLIASR